MNRERESKKFGVVAAARTHYDWVEMRWEKRNGMSAKWIGENDTAGVDSNKSDYLFISLSIVLFVFFLSIDAAQGEKML